MKVSVSVYSTSWLKKKKKNSKLTKERGGPILLDLTIILEVMVNHYITSD